MKLGYFFYVYLPLITKINYCEDPYAVRFPLHAAAKNNDFELVARLINDGDENENSSDTQGMTPLHIAARFGCSNSAETLLLMGAEPYVKNDSGFLPEDIALTYGHLRLGGFISGWRACMEARKLQGQE